MRFAINSQLVYKIRHHGLILLNNFDHWALLAVQRVNIFAGEPSLIVKINRQRATDDDQGQKQSEHLPLESGNLATGIGRGDNVLGIHNYLAAGLT